MGDRKADIRVNENELLRALATPGAVALVLVWLNARMNRVEARLDSMAEFFGAPKPQKKTRVWLGLIGLCAIGAAVLSGCASVHQTMTNGETVTESRILAVWPATTSLDKSSVKQTKTTQAAGAEGVKEDSGGTNIVSALSEIRRIIESVK